MRCGVTEAVVGQKNWECVCTTLKGPTQRGNSLGVPFILILMCYTQKLVYRHCCTVRTRCSTAKVLCPSQFFVAKFLAGEALHAC
jgi:hypothetical protein